MTERISQGLERLNKHIGADGFLEKALDLRSSRMVSALEPLPKKSVPPQVTSETLVRHAPLAITHLRMAQGSLDFTIPGEHVAIHPGVDRELRFIADTAEFRISDIPGQASDDVRVALVSRLISSGLLEVAE